MSVSTPGPSDAPPKLGGMSLSLLFIIAAVIVFAIAALIAFTSLSGVSLGGLIALGLVFFAAGHLPV